jgi:hypothetical protein
MELANPQPRIGCSYLLVGATTVRHDVHVYYVHTYYSVHT